MGQTQRPGDGTKVGTNNEDTATTFAFTQQWQERPYCSENANYVGGKHPLRNGRIRQNLFHLVLGAIHVSLGKYISFGIDTCVAHYCFQGKVAIFEYGPHPFYGRSGVVIIGHVHHHGNNFSFRFNGFKLGLFSHRNKYGPTPGGEVQCGRFSYPRTSARNQHRQFSGQSSIAGPRWSPRNSKKPGDQGHGNASSSSDHFYRIGVC
mmetsp:Transcript_36105/g.52932  ORF Transcript_36105/g.52932 Transcript_36105/m.52932 type:complete len:206 (-) Transcript_36105:42-659(-)